MSSYPHAYAFDGPSGGAGSGWCRHCGVSDEDESAAMECPVRLREALDLETAHRTHNDTVRAVADNNNRLQGRR